MNWRCCHIKQELLINGQIRANEVEVIDDNGGKLGVMSLEKALDLVAENKISCIAECNPLHGPLVEELIQKYRNGEQIQETVYISESVFTKENLTQEFIDQRTY